MRTTMYIVWKRVYSGAWYADGLYPSKWAATIDAEKWYRQDALRRQVHVTQTQPKLPAWEGETDGLRTH